jgi:hypothetical protein
VAVCGKAFALGGGLHNSVLVFRVSRPLEKIGRSNMNTTWTELGWSLDLIQDPETGLALLAKRPEGETPEQEQERQFWQLQFHAMRDWRAGDVQAVGRALIGCSLPFWLLKASLSLCEQCMSDDEKRARGDINKHYLRWRAVQLVRGRHPNDPRNFKRKVRGDRVWAEAAKLVADMGVKVSAETVKKSYALIKRAGGAQVTLPSYRRELEKRDWRRKEKKARSTAQEKKLG